MSIPTHGSDCHTTTYPSACRSCGKHIFILQCTCGSAVLLNSLGWPWPHHQCLDPNLPRGWRAIQKLRDMGIPIDHRVIKYAYDPKSPTSLNTPPPTLTKVKSESGKKLELITLLRECHSNTKHTQKLQQLGTIGQKMFNMSSSNIIQLTLHDTSASPPRSYRCLFPSAPINLSANIGNLVAVVLEGVEFGSFSTWVVRELCVV